jgi:5'(3')-deoxyribonucleotidase
MNKIIFLDYDETLVDLLSPTLKYIRNELNITIKREEVIEYNYLSNLLGEVIYDYWNNNTYENVIPFSGSVNFVKNLKSLGYNICIISSCHINNSLHKLNHISNFFPFVDNFIPVFDHNKHKYTKDSILIDDYNKNIIEHTIINNAPGLLFSYNSINKWCLSNETYTSYNELYKFISSL